jgi:nucleoside 2-deoxyribosyltransferase
MPAFRRAMPGEKERVDVLALNRFLLIATVQAMSPAPNAARAPLPKPEKPEEWIEKFNIEALRDASKKIERMDVSKDHSMVVEKIDEINPKLSSKSTWSFSVEEQIQGRK